MKKLLILILFTNLTYTIYAAPTHTSYISEQQLLDMTDAQLKTLSSNILKNPAHYTITNLELFENLLTFQNLCQASDVFSIATKTAFPVQANRIKALGGADKEKQLQIVHHAQKTRIILAAESFTAMQSFLDYKKSSGSTIEKSLYDNMTIDDFIDRLITKRPLMFMTAQDQYLLRNGTTGAGGFETIGTPQEKAPLILRDYLSYQEMQFASLISISTPTYFINNGNRYNRGVPQRDGNFEAEGVFVGMVGTRFEKADLMESEHMLIKPGQGKKRGPLNVIWQKLYATSFVSYEKLLDDETERFVRLADHATYFDTAIYKKRLELIIAPFLADANERGKQANKKIYCHITGLGLGVWKIDKDTQTKLLIESYLELFTTHAYPYIADLDFSYFDEPGKSTYSTYAQTLNFPKTITIHFSYRNPADKLTGDNAGKLLIAQYAWDGNAYPGNEYWAGMLSASGDPAAASCSTIAELQNPLINPYLRAEHMLVVE